MPDCVENEIDKLLDSKENDFYILFENSSKGQSITITKFKKNENNFIINKIVNYSNRFVFINNKSIPIIFSEDLLYSSKLKTEKGKIQTEHFIIVKGLNIIYAEDKGKCKLIEVKFVN